MNYTDCSATDLFAFQGAQSKRDTNNPSQQQKQQHVLLPVVIAQWPALPPDPISASISAQTSREVRAGEELDEKDLTNKDSLLVAAIDDGSLQGFLDGTYPLGPVRLGDGREALEIMKDSTGSSTIFVHAVFRSPWSTDLTASAHHTLMPLPISFPLLYAKPTRHIAESSTAARELTWYAMRVVKEMRKAWFGDGSQSGARDLGASYVRGLERWQIRFNRTL